MKIAQKNYTVMIKRYVRGGATAGRSLASLWMTWGVMFIFLCLSFLSINGFSGTIQTQNIKSIPTQELQDFNKNSTSVKKLIAMALELATKNIGYLYGSADPGTGGMDCSGTIYYLLRQFGIKDVPRSSDLIYQWVTEKGHFYTVNEYDFSSLQFSHLQPGDLLFWNGTYEIERKINVTHVMLYLGKNKEGEPLMFGSSDGRYYKENKVYGVSVFSFKLPVALSKSKFLGYSCIPHDTVNLCNSS